MKTLIKIYRTVGRDEFYSNDVLTRAEMSCLRTLRCDNLLKRVANGKTARWVITDKGVDMIPRYERFVE